MTVLRWLERHFEESIACACLAVVASSVFAQVVMRYGFNSALKWSEEVAGMAMVWAVYMGAALGVRERFHIRIMAGVLLLPRPAARAVILAADAIWAAFCVYMLVVSVEYLGVLSRFTSRTPSLGIDELYPQSILVIGYVLILARLIQIYVLWLRAGARGNPGMRPEHEMDPASNEMP